MSALDGVALFGRGAEDAERPVLALHCMLGAARAWEGLVPASVEGQEVALLAPDFPSHGGSAPWDALRHPDYQRLCTQIAAGLIARPVDLIGHSFGAVVALRLAVAAPDAVRSLTLIEPVLFAALPEGETRDHLRATQAQFEAMIAQGEAEAAAARFYARWGAGEAWESLSQSRRARFTALAPVCAAAGRAHLDDPSDILRAGGLESIDAPVMMILGEESPSIVHEAAAVVAGRFADVGTAVVPQAGHMLPFTHSASVRDLIAMNLERS